MPTVIWVVFDADDLLGVREHLAATILRSFRLVILLPASQIERMRAHEGWREVSFIELPLGLNVFEVVHLIKIRSPEYLLGLGWRAWLLSIALARLAGVLKVFGWVRELEREERRGRLNQTAFRLFVNSWIYIWSFGLKRLKLFLLSERPTTPAFVSKRVSVCTLSSGGIAIDSFDRSLLTNENGVMPRVLFVGDTRWSHRFAEVLAGCSQLWALGVQFTLHFSSSNSFDASTHIPKWLLKRWVERYSSNLIDRQNSRSVEELLLDSDIVVQGGHGSLSWAPPVFLLRAGGVGLPMLVPNEPYFRRFVLPGESGFLIDASNPSSWAEKLRVLVEDAELRGKMGQRARDDILSRLDRERVLERQMEVFGLVT